jgi:hypothetical protein
VTGVQTCALPICSGTYTHEAVEFLRAGRIGDIHMVRVYNMVRRPPIDPQPDGPAPDNVDYDLWTGPAPLRPFNPNRFHYHWHWCWDFSGGDIINDGVHQVDAARMSSAATTPTLSPAPAASWRNRTRPRHPTP